MALRRKFNTKPAAWFIDASRNIKRKVFGETWDGAYDAARALCDRAVERARANGEQLQDRFYISHLGVSYSFDPTAE
jgi:hypothetical protein